MSLAGIMNLEHWPVLERRIAEERDQRGRGKNIRWLCERELREE
jgi:hypothetical protein